MTPVDHGGHDPGAVGFLGVRECDVTLSIALLIAKAFRRQGVRAPHIMLTHNGSGASLWERSEFANTTRADVFLSIHCNAAADQAACGFEVWTSPGQTDADAYATAIYNAVRAAFPWIKMRSDYDDGDPDKEARFHVLRKTYMPAVLIEFGFLTNPEDAEMLMDQSTREHYANAVTSAVTEVLPVGA